MSCRFVACLGLSALAFAVGIGGLGLRRAEAQPPRRPLLDLLLKGVVEPQVDRLLQQNRNRPQNVQQVAFNPSQAATVLSNLAHEAEHLSEAIHRHSAAGHDTTMEGAALRIKAMGEQVARLCRNRQNLQAVPAIAADIDQQWRDLEFAIQESPELSTTCQSEVAAVGKQHTALVQMFRIRPIFSRSKALELLDALRTKSYDLAQRLQSNARFNRNLRDLVFSAIQVDNHVKEVTYMVRNNNDIRGLKPKIDSLLKEWRPLQSKIIALHDRTLTDRARQVDSAIHAVRVFFRIRQTLDNQQLLQFARELRNDIEGLFGTITLAQVLTLRRPAQFLPAASEFSGYCEYFEYACQQKEDRGSIVSAYRDMDNSWSELRQRLRALNNQATVRSTEEIQLAMESLRRILGVPNANTHQDQYQSAAEIASMASDLQSRVLGLMNNNRYRQLDRRLVAQDTTRFSEAAKAYYEGKLRGGDQRTNSNNFRNLIKTWQTLNAGLDRLNSRDRSQITTITGNISQKLLLLNLDD